MSEYYRLDDPYGSLPPLELKQSTAFALYVDQGPTGVCGQSMDITCPWAQLHLFDTYEDLKASKIGRRGLKAHVIFGIVGEWSGAGHLTIVDHREKKSES